MLKVVGRCKNKYVFNVEKNFCTRNVEVRKAAIRNLRVYLRSIDRLFRDQYPLIFDIEGSIYQASDSEK